MPAYDFKPRFAAKVATGEKRQTIRAVGKRRPPRVGDPLMLYTGLRTDACRKLLDAVCTAVEPISIEPERRAVRMVRGYGENKWWADIDQEEIDVLAQADGFDDAEAFFAFFREQYGRSTLSGYLIRW